jgi:hypothetical protein
MKGGLHWLVRWTCHAGKRDFCPVLAAQVGVCPQGIAQQADQAAVMGRLYLGMCLWYSLLQLHACYKMQYARCNFIIGSSGVDAYTIICTQQILFVGYCARILEQSMGARNRLCHI